MKKLIILFYFLILVYQIQFKFFPFGVHVFFGSLGMIAALSVYFAKDGRYLSLKRSANVMTVLKYWIPCLLCSIFSMGINGSSDFHLIQGTATMFFSFYAFFLLAYLFHNAYRDVSNKKIIHYFVIAQIVYLGISLACFYRPELYDSIVVFLRRDAIAESISERLMLRRLQGLGVNFFAAGALCGTVLILISLYLYYYELKVKEIVFMVLSFIVITILGMMMARTTMIGAGIGLSIMLLKILKYRKGSTKFFAALLLTGSLMVTLSGSIAGIFNDNVMADLSDFGFEAVVNFEDTGALTTGSFETQKGMYSVLPDNPKTWLIGDAQWLSKGGYYKSTDIGYNRNIFFFGLIGLAFYFFFHYIFLKKTFANRSFRSMFVLFVMIIYMLLMNFKGAFDLYNILLIFYFCNINKDKVQFVNNVKS